MNLTRLTSLRCCLIVLLALSALCVASPADEVADLVLLDGKVITLNAANKVVDAIAIRSGRVLRTGSNREIESLIGAKTKTIRLGKKVVIPGLIETHCHAIGVGRAARQQPYVELSTLAEVQAWIRQRAEQIPAGRWIQVPRADITRLRERRHPTRAELDAACKTHPVIFTAARKSVLNSLGLKRVEIDDETREVPGGKLLRDDAGRVEMIAGGMGHLRLFLPRRQFSQQEDLEGLKRVHQIYNQVGITSIFERATDLKGVQLYQTLRDKDQLTVRTTATIRQQFRSGEQLKEFSEKLGVRTGDGDDWVRVGPLKITVDGGIHWGNTYLREDYGQRRIQFYRLSDPTFRGDRRYQLTQLIDIFRTGHKLGWQMCCHVTGDAGVDLVLDALETVNKQQRLTDRRFTLIHCYFPADDAVRRAGRLGLCVDTQPYLYFKDSAAIAEVYGVDWAERFIGVGDWLQGGVTTAINSDHMIGLDPNHAMNSFNPFLQMYIAISRQNEQGKVYASRQRLSRLDALRCMTSHAAYLSFDEKKKGTLEPGKLADLVVLDRDLLTCPEEQIREIQVLRTMVNGRFVFERK